uniref:Uncharacterized protein n=1 Tax=Physcomitrium patens TaxID=3218 RepID=A0A2K1K7H9_PHYPA|nr:hypothetical protein PHYPA_011635 [Physcomitrium patens]
MWLLDQSPQNNQCNKMLLQYVATMKIHTYQVLPKKGREETVITTIYNACATNTNPKWDFGRKMLRSDAMERRTEGDSIFICKVDNPRSGCRSVCEEGEDTAV